MGKENKPQSRDSRILPEIAVQGLPSKEVDAVPTNEVSPVKNKKDTSKLESLFTKLR